MIFHIIAQTFHFVNYFNTQSKPKYAPPFKCYLYCEPSNSNQFLNCKNSVDFYLEERDTLGGHGSGLYRRVNNTVACEFLCNSITQYIDGSYNLEIVDLRFFEKYVSLKDFILSESQNKDKLLVAPEDWSYVLERRELI